MAAQSTTLSSLGTSTAIILDPVKRTTTIQLTVTSGAASFGTIQYTLDDPTVQPTPTLSWASISSAIASSAVDANGGLIYSVLSPLGGLRLNSTAFTGGTSTLKALQTVTG